MCPFSCVPFVLNSHCSHTPCFPCVATFMKAICREHWKQTCHFSSVAVSSTFVLVPIMGEGSFSHKLPLFSHLPSKWPNWPRSGPNWPGLKWPKKWAKLTKKWMELTKKWAELTWAELTRKLAKLTRAELRYLVGWIDLGWIGTGPNWLEALLDACS